MPIKLVVFMLLSLTSCQVYPPVLPRHSASRPPVTVGPCIHYQSYGEAFVVQQFRILCPSYGQTDRPFEGLIQDQTSHLGLADVTISLQRIEEDEPLTELSTITSDTEGRYHLSFSQPGMYRVRFGKIGYVSVEITLEYKLSTTKPGPADPEPLLTLLEPAT